MSPEIPERKPDIDPSTLSVEILNKIHFVFSIGRNDEEFGILKGFLDEVKSDKISVERLVQISTALDQMIIRKQDGMPDGEESH